MAMPRMTIKDFDEHEQWQVFAAEYIANGGVMESACEKAGFHKRTASKTKGSNPNFVKWLAEIVDRKMSSAINKGDICLADNVATGKPMDSAMRGTLKLLYERKDKLGAKLEIHNNMTINHGEALGMDVIKDLIDFEVAKQIRENALAGVN